MKAWYLDDNHVTEDQFNSPSFVEFVKYL